MNNTETKLNENSHEMRQKRTVACALILSILIGLLTSILIAREIWDKMVDSIPSDAWRKKNSCHTKCDKMSKLDTMVTTL